MLRKQRARIYERKSDIYVYWYKNRAERNMSQLSAKVSPRRKGSKQPLSFNTFTWVRVYWGREVPTPCWNSWRSKMHLRFYYLYKYTFIRYHIAGHLLNDLDKRQFIWSTWSSLKISHWFSGASFAIIKTRWVWEKTADLSWKYFHIEITSVAILSSEIDDKLNRFSFCTRNFGTNGKSIIGVIEWSNSNGTLASTGKFHSSWVKLTPFYLNRARAIQSFN